MPQARGPATGIDRRKFALEYIMNKDPGWFTAAAFRSVRRRPAGPLVLMLVIIFDTGPALAQLQLPMQMLMASPFAGRMGAMGPRNMAPYGSQAGAMPHVMQSTNGLMMNTQNSGTATQGSIAETFGMEGLVPHRRSGQGPMQMAERTPGEGEIEAPEVDAGEGWTELLIGACAGGAFIGAFAAATAVSAVPVAAAAAAPVAVTAAATAMGVGCGIGVATASVSFGAIFGYRALAE